MLIIKPLNIKRLSLLNFSFPIAVLSLTCIDLEERGFSKDTTSWVFPNYSKINACLTLKFMYLKARLLVSFHTAGTFWLSCHGQTIFNIVIFGYLCQFSWFIFIVSHCVCNVRVRSFFCSVFFRIRKSHYLCTLYIRIACLIYLKNK